MLVHKCDYCKKEIENGMKIPFVVSMDGYYNKDEFCSLKCIVDYIKNKEKIKKRSHKLYLKWKTKREKINAKEEK